MGWVPHTPGEPPRGCPEGHCQMPSPSPLKTHVDWFSKLPPGPSWGYGGDPVFHSQDRTTLFLLKLPVFLTDVFVLTLFLCFWPYLCQVMVLTGKPSGSANSSTLQSKIDYFSFKPNEGKSWTLTEPVFFISKHRPHKWELGFILRHYSPQSAVPRFSKFLRHVTLMLRPLTFQSPPHRSWGNSC